MRRLIFAFVVALLPGCDVATAALVLSAQDKSSSDDGPPPVILPPAPEFKAYVAQVTDAPGALQNLLDTGGHPDINFWTEIGVFTATETFDPVNTLPPFNSILITASSTQSFELDCVEILNANESVVLEYASGTTYSNLVGFPDEILGPPDGVGAVTNAVDPDLAFLFTIYNGPIDKFRINGRQPSTPPASGDTVAVGGYTSAGNERPGGMAIRNGIIHMTLSVGDTASLVRYDLAGVLQDEMEISDDLVSVGNGSHSVALNAEGVIFTACSVQAGVVQVRRLETDLSETGIAGFTSGLGNDRVEHNSITVDNAGFVVVVGGMSTLLSGRNHWKVKLPDTVSGTPVWQDTVQLDGTQGATYWHAVATDSNNEVYTTGDLLSGFLGTIQIYTANFTSNNTPEWPHEYVEGQQPADVGHAIALDSAGNVFVGGAVGTDSGARNGILLHLTSDGTQIPEQNFVGQAGGNDEILDIAVDPDDGSIYAVGYETVAGQGENMWVRKYVFTGTEFNTIWTRTHHGGFGNDRAVSVAISGTNLVVAGFETNSTSQTKLVLRVYEK